jgi:tripartite ATP-independent transporter DctP family solute receptor
MNTSIGAESAAHLSGTLSRRRFIGLLGSAAAVPLLPSPARGAASKIVMRVAHVLTEHDNIHRAVVRFREAVEKKTDGQVEVQIFPNSALGSLRVTFESMQLGNLEAGLWDAVTPGNVASVWAVPELPYIFRDLAHVHRVLDGPIGRDMAKALLDKAKVRTLAVYDTTFRKIFTKTKAINSLADMKGLKIRVPEAQTYVRCMQLLGANPTPVAWGELYTALETGVVQGFENKCEAAFNAKLHEQTKFAAYTGHIFVLNPLMCSDRWFGGLPKDVQQIVLDAAKESLAWQRAEAPASEKSFEQKMKDAGVTFTSPDVGPFRQAVEPFYREYGDKINANDLIKRVREA